MKTSRKAPDAGIALVIVLAFLILISVLIVGFFSSVSTELSNSKAVSTSATTRQLADSAINVVMSQLVDATKGKNSDGPLAWVSQPGMIRTFDAKGKPRDFFKLYSSDQMVVGGTNFDPAAEIPPTDWKSADNANSYTDLNAPSLNVKGELVYPILDPSADGTPAPGRPNDKFTVEGFSITAPPGFNSAAAEAATNNRAPMPVKWLYVLQDGTLHPGTLPTASSLTVSAASATNPVVGRIAFWADDESGKVNINTASEGTYWDVPRVYSKEDFGQYSGGNVSIPGMSVCQPNQREFQRYPGHPATTSLSAVFGSVLKVTSPYPANPSAADAGKLDPYYNMTPRVGLANGAGSGGSKGGTEQVAAGNSTMTVDTERLYASLDELMFSPSYTAAAVPARIPNTSTVATPKTITKDTLEKAKFFLTANSSAPETTLNNTPRIAVWPVWEDANKRTAYESLLAFCSTIGGKQYYFTRSNPRSSTADYTPRNAMLYRYLQALTATDVPGFGGNFLVKYPQGLKAGVSERDQILTNIYDYIRCTNLQDQSDGATPYTPLFSNGQPRGAGEVIPIKIGETQGFGRFYGISSANLLFYGTSSPAANAPATKMRAVFILGFTTPQQGLACMRSNVKYTVTGLDSLTANGKSLNFKSGGTNYMDTADLSLYHGRSVGGTESAWQAVVNKPFADGDAGGDAPGHYPFFSNQDVDVGSSASNGFALQSSGEVVVEIRAVDTNELIQTARFRFPDTLLKVPKVVNSATTATYATRGMSGNWLTLVTTSDTAVGLQTGGDDTSTNASAPGPAMDSTAGDIRMTTALADVPSNRFRADNEYKATTAGGVQFAHNLIQSIGVPYNGGSYGKLVNVPGPSFNAATYGDLGPINGSSVVLTPGSYAYLQPRSTAYNVFRQPDVPSRAASGVTRKGGGPGDWDTGFGDQKDGAYINKPDEGDTALQDSTGSGTRLPYFLGYGKGFASAASNYFSPNRQIPSPLMFGSIPTGVQRMLPWQTLLFHPRPEDSTHPGFGSPAKPAPGQAYTLPPDHLLADLFWMPVVEPYAISQPFATSGKINLNYQILPFTYINRATGLHAVMKSTKFAALPLADANTYKPLDASGNSTAPTNFNRRRSIDMAKTLAAFKDKFDNKEVYTSASQICEMNLVPADLADNVSASDYKSMASFWNSHKLTGDNLREKPYVDLYSRLTTKSNTFTVHVRVQSLKKVPGTPPDKWVTGKDRVLGEYRGSAILERYIDVNDPELAKFDFAALFATNPGSNSLNIDQYYKMRVISAKRFAP